MGAKNQGKFDDPENLRKLKEFMRIKPTLDDTAAFFDVNPSTVERACKKYYKKTFAEFRDQNMVHTRHDLIRTAIRKAMKGDNVMLIFCLKNLCGWKDKWDNSDEPQQNNFPPLAFDPKGLKPVKGNAS